VDFSYAVTDGQSSAVGTVQSRTPREYAYYVVDPAFAAQAATVVSLSVGNLDLPLGRF